MEDLEECGCQWMASAYPLEYVECPLCGHSIFRPGWESHAYSHALEGEGEILILEVK